MILLGNLLALVATFTLIIGTLAWIRRLPGNKYIGIKVPEVRKSKEIWDSAHQFAGPPWVAAGVCLAVASVPPFSGVSWLLIVTLVGTVAAVYFFGLGASIGARAASVIESAPNNEAVSEGCCSGGATEETSVTASQRNMDQQQDTTDSDCAPSGCSNCTSNACSTAQNIDLEALKRAAQSADRSQKTH